MVNAQFSMGNISTVGMVSVTKKWVLETSRREITEDVSSLGRRAMEPGKRPQGVVIYTVVYCTAVYHMFDGCTQLIDSSSAHV